MKRSLRFAAPAALLCSAAYIVGPTAAHAWTLLGWNLNVNQRDVRVFNNFSDPTANNNVTPDPMFPGYDGAERAIWKAAVEWGSRLHGDGTGDPHQPTSLGSGGANFDFSWQGNANGIPGALTNIVWEDPGCNGGVLATTQSAGTGDWRMWYYRCHTWHDGPDISWPSQNGHYDIQGIGTHELGHSLGLGHSTTPGATMEAAVSSTGSKLIRSIANDDIGGVRAIYGVASASKPIISDMIWNGSTMTVLGSNFAPTGNQVWFTQAGTGGNGVPIKALALDSLDNGTRIDTAVPAAAGSGDILVRVPGGGHTVLSNAWPFDITTPNGCAPPTNYCTAGPNSTGGAVGIQYLGSQSLASDNLLFFGTNMPANQFGIFISSQIQGVALVGDGILCVGTPFYRWDILQADFIGLWQYDPPLNNPPDINAAISSGETWNWQLWYRDPTGGPAGFNFSDGIEIEFCP